MALEEPINTEWYVPRLVGWPLKAAPQVLMCTDYNCFVMGDPSVFAVFPVPDFHPKLPAKSFQSLMVTGLGTRLTCGMQQWPQTSEEARIKLGSAQVVAPLAFFAWLHPMKSWGTHEP